MRDLIYKDGVDSVACMGTSSKWPIWNLEFEMPRSGGIGSRSSLLHGLAWWEYAAARRMRRNPACRGIGRFTHQYQ